MQLKQLSREDFQSAKSIVDTAFNNHTKDLEDKGLLSRVLDCEKLPDDSSCYGLFNGEFLMGVAVTRSAYDYRDVEPSILYIDLLAVSNFWQLNV